MSKTGSTTSNIIEQVEAKVTLGKRTRVNRAGWPNMVMRLGGFIREHIEFLDAIVRIETHECDSLGGLRVDSILITDEDRKRHELFDRSDPAWAHVILAAERFLVQPCEKAAYNDEGRELLAALELPLRQKYEDEIEVYAHRVQFRFWDIPNELTDEFKETLERAAMDRIEPSIRDGYVEGQLQYQEFDSVTLIPGWWEIKR